MLSKAAAATAMPATEMLAAPRAAAVDRQSSAGLLATATLPYATPPSPPLYTLMCAAAVPRIVTTAAAAAAAWAVPPQATTQRSK